MAQSLKRGGGIGFTLEGVDGLIAKLDQLERNMKRKYARDAVGAAGEVLAKHIRMRTPVEHGLLRKSIAVKRVVYAGRSKRAAGLEPDTVAVAIVGTDTSVKEQRGTRVYRSTHKGKQYATPKARFTKPSQYAHLVEYGFVGPDGNFVPGHGFMRGGAAAGREEALAAMASSLAASLAAEGLA